MQIGRRLQRLREEKNFSQGDIEKRTGLLRCYISRVENGHTVPSVETLEKLARAFEMPLYKMMYEGDEPPQPQKLSSENGEEDLWGSSGSHAEELDKLRGYLSKMDDKQRAILLGLATTLARNSR
jgi:transcriptional regulator with XRE-family HTH domain